MAHTKGEWKAEYRSGGDYEITSDGFVGCIAKVNVDCYAVKSNAHLIAAAPDLLEALKAVLSTVIVNDDMTTSYAIDGKTRKQINRALAKAEGKGV